MEQLGGLFSTNAGHSLYHLDICQILFWLKKFTPKLTRSFPLNVERWVGLNVTRSQHDDQVVLKTQHPFVQVVTDVISPSAVFHKGHVILVGDALSGARPHTTASTYA